MWDKAQSPPIQLGQPNIQKPLEKTSTSQCVCSHRPQQMAMGQNKNPKETRGGWVYFSYQKLGFFMVFQVFSVCLNQRTPPNRRSWLPGWGTSVTEDLGAQTLRNEANEAGQQEQAEGDVRLKVSLVGFVMFF